MLSYLNAHIFELKVTSVTSTKVYLDFVNAFTFKTALKNNFRSQLLIFSMPMCTRTFDNHFMIYLNTKVVLENRATTLLK